MITALRDIGEWVRGRNTSSDYLDDIIENPNDKGNYNNVIYLLFQVDDNRVTYQGHELEEFSTQKLKKYLYKKGAANGGNFTPTLLYTGDIAKSIRNINKPIAKVEHNHFKSLAKYLNLDLSIKEISEKLSPVFQPKQGYIITLKLNDKFLNEYEPVVNQLLKANDSKYYEKYDTVSRSEQKTCFVCSKLSSEVYGFVNTFNFTTFDKDGMVTGGFDKSYTWKNYPVCPECSINLESGRDYVKEKLKGYFAGLNYMVIPKIVISGSDSINEIELLENKIKLSLKKDNRRKLTNAENDLFEALADSGNTSSLNFMFYEEVKSAFSILLFIEDVLPSRVGKIFEAKEKMDNDQIFHGMPGKDNTTYNMNINFNLIRETFFPSSKMEGVWDKNFLEILSAIFTDKKLDYQFIIKRMIEKIRIDQHEGNYFTVMKSLIFYEFILELQLFKDYNYREDKTMVEKTEDNRLYLDFFEARPGVFNTDTKKAAFIVGILVQKLLNLPEQRGNKPFYARLNGLKVDERVLKRVFVEAQNKMNEYKKNYYFKLEGLAGEYLAASDFSKTSENELSYYFTLGMNLCNKFKIKEEDKIEEETL